MFGVKQLAAQVRLHWRCTCLAQRRLARINAELTTLRRRVARIERIAQRTEIGIPARAADFGPVVALDADLRVIDAEVG